MILLLNVIADIPIELFLAARIISPHLSYSIRQCLPFIQHGLSMIGWRIQIEKPTKLSRTRTYSTDHPGTGFDVLLPTGRSAFVLVCSTKALMRRLPGTSVQSSKSTAILAFEILLLAAWTLFLLRHYLNFDPLYVPYGREYFTSIQTHFMWDRARECGQCAMWNGSVRGGYPVFADVHDSML